MPVPGDVDIAIASELMEAGRAIQRGLITPDRTTLVASINRVFSMTEKVAMADGRVSDEKLIDACRSAAKTMHAFDMVAIADDKAQAEIWIGAEDKLPRMIRLTYFDEPGNFRHVVAFSNWHLNGVIAPDAFSSDKLAKAIRIKFASPDEKLPKP